jgi:hypothetical protein
LAISGITASRSSAISSASSAESGVTIAQAEEGHFPPSPVLWVSEYVINYGGKRVFTVSVMEFRDGKVAHETQYFADSFDAPTWRAQWVARAP